MHLLAISFVANVPCVTFAGHDDSFGRGLCYLSMVTLAVRES